MEFNVGKLQYNMWTNFKVVRIMTKTGDLPYREDLHEFWARWPCLKNNLQSIYRGEESSVQNTNNILVIYE
jgi:hypothetical protein